MKKTLAQEVESWSTEHLYSKPDSWSLGLLMRVATNPNGPKGQPLCDIYTAQRADPRLMWHDLVEPGLRVLRPEFEWAFPF